MPSAETESKRVRKFRHHLASKIPKFPNNRDTLRRLEEEDISQLLIHYMNWAIRYVAPKPRSTHIDETAKSDPRWQANLNAISNLLKKAQDGEDLTPYLSLQPHTRGYTPEASATGPDVDRWADKDFLLNVMGYHHFHLGENITSQGFADRTDDLLFARVTRDHFDVVATFDHSVFDQEVTGDREMSQERERLWRIFDEHSSHGLPAGSVYISSMITTSGHPLHIVRLAIDYARIIKEIDPRLDDREFINTLYETADFQAPKNPKISWAVNFLDLGVVDDRTNTFMVFRYGPN